MNPQQIAQLNTLLMQGISLLESLSKIYDAELETLSAKDLNKLSDVTQEKTDLLNKFHKFTLERSELLQSFGLAIDAQDYKIPEESLREDREGIISNAHNKIKQLLIDLKKKNDRNEQTIYRNQQNVNQLLAIVRGHKDQNKIYDRSGSSGLYKAQSRLGKA